ncbi:MAG: 3-oxoadipate enol-lactonase [Pseudomonadota bacterium]|nr:3-oxoadipate enol-lactonase [Pseudomonadota bacterium]
MPVACVNGVEINYRWDGQENHPVLILSNSLTTNFNLWNDQVASFTKHFRVLRYDNRGHGGSSSPPGEYSIDDIGSDILALMDYLEVERASLCGISLGGMVGMWLGINAGPRMDKLVICNTSSDLSPPDPWQDRIDKVMSHGMEAIITGALERFLSESFRKNVSPKIDLIKSMIRSCDVLGYSGCCAAVRDMNLTSELPRIKNPTLIVAGELDPSTPVAHSELIKQNVVGSSMVVIDGVAHLSNIEEPVEFNKAVLNFLLR